MQVAIGTGVDVQRFVQKAVTAHGGSVGQVGNLSYAIHLPSKTAICEACGDVETFTIVKRRDEAAHGEYRTKRVILEIYDAMQRAKESGQPYQTRLDPPPTDARAAASRHV